MKRPRLGGDTALIIGGVLVLALVLFGGLWLSTSAPCGLFKFTNAGEVPARCLMR